MCRNSTPTWRQGREKLNEYEKERVSHSEGMWTKVKEGTRESPLILEGGPSQDLQFLSDGQRSPCQTWEVSLLTTYLSPLLLSPTHFWQGLLQTTGLQYLFFVLCRNSHKYKLEKFGLVFPCIAFVDDDSWLYLLIWFQWLVMVGKTGNGIIFVFQTVITSGLEWDLCKSWFLDSGDLNTRQVCSWAPEGGITIAWGPEERARADFSPNNHPCHSAGRSLMWQK